MDFRTAILPKDARSILSHSDAVMLVGSCFSDHIGSRMGDALMRVLVNPLGTVYNPLSVCGTLKHLVSGAPVAGSELFLANGVWNSFEFHSRYSLPDKAAALEKMNRSIARGHDFLEMAQCLIVTLGTSVVYRRRDTGVVVSNCHKVPQHEFARSMASIDEMTGALREMLEMLHEFNPALRVIFTISPIRHIADGLETNSLSKAMLRVAVEQAQHSHPGFTGYFPSYEIMLDDLRDYRFYAADMVHPSEVAIEYIWQLFQASYFDDQSAQAIARCERASKRLKHRPMSSNHDVVKRFNADTKAVLRNLVKVYPYLSDNERITQALD